MLLARLGWRLRGGRLSPLEVYSEAPNSYRKPSSVLRPRVSLLGYLPDGSCGGWPAAEKGVAVALGQALEPDAGAVGLLRMTPGVEDGGDQGGGVPGPIFSAQPMKRSGVHSPIRPVLLGHMLCCGGVAPRVRRADVRLATRWPRWKHSTVRAVSRTSEAGGGRARAGPWSVAGVADVDEELVDRRS